MSNMHDVQSKGDAYKAIRAYEADPQGVDTCDLLCDVAEYLDLPNGEYTPDELRDLLANE